MEIQVGELARSLEELQAQNTSIQWTLDNNLSNLNDVGIWRPQIDSKVDELHQSILNLQQKVDHLTSRPPSIEPTTCTFDTEYIDLTKPVAAHLAATSTEATSRLLGHGSAIDHQGTDNGVVTTIVPSPAKGAPKFPSVTAHSYDSQSNFHMNSAMPQLDFPKFDGMSPKLWQKHCESYFDVYAVPPSLWVKLIVMNFVGSAAFWSQSVESIL